jgi:adenosine deaminase
VSTALPYSDYLDLVPKVELHLHIAGAVRASTLIDIATANGVRMPRPAEMLYQWQDFYGFLELLRVGAAGTSATPKSSSIHTITRPAGQLTQRSLMV